MSKLISIRFYDQISEASKDKHLLEENGINGFIITENLVNADWLLSQTVRGIQLQVFDDDIEHAVKILENGSENQVIDRLNEAIKMDRTSRFCSRCGSHYIFRIEKLGGVFGMSWYILGFPIEIPTAYYYCYYCDGEFSC